MKDIGDNLIFAVNGESKERFKMALELALNGNKAIGYRIDPSNGLILYWAKPTYTDIEMFIMPLDVDGLIDQLYSWVMNDDERKKIKLGTTKDNSEINAKDNYILSWNFKFDGIDGSNIKGWVIYVNSWGHVSGWDKLSSHDYCTICAIAPSWLWAGK